jgi:hypothetical protein
MKILFTKKTFSMQVLQWWINMQQQHISRGENPCQKRYESYAAMTI